MHYCCCFITGKSLSVWSEALIFASTNPQYDNRLFMKIVNSEYMQNMLRTQIVVFYLFWHLEQIWYTTCSADVASFWKRFTCIFYCCCFITFCSGISIVFVCPLKLICKNKRWKWQLKAALFKTIYLGIFKPLPTLDILDVTLILFMKVDVFFVCFLYCHCTGYHTMHTKKILLRSV